MMAWCTGLPTLAALLFLMVPSFVYSAPVIEHNTEMDSYYPVADSTGCYYNFQHYDEGDRIITNEPCLNCTCHNRMLMCYLRVCPFIKAIGENCKVEKRADQCCPIITCPEVPVQLLTSTTTEPSGVSSEVGHLDTYGCSIDKLFYSDGARVPSDLNKPCELCYCIRNKTACVMQECTLHIEGCKPVYQEGVCCPVRYDCEHPEETLTETTALPTTTTTLRSIFTTLPAATPSDCIHDGEIFADGALIKKDICDHCYCMKGDIVCAVQECGPTPLDKVNCTALPVKEGQCCPDTYDCENISEEELTTTYYEMTTQTAVKQIELEHATKHEIITGKPELEKATSQPELNEEISTEINEQATPVQIYESQTSKISEEKSEFEEMQTLQPQTDNPTEISEQTIFAHTYENQVPEIPEERKPILHPEEAITSAQQTTEVAEESYTQAVTGTTPKPTEEVPIQKQEEPTETTEQLNYNIEEEQTPSTEKPAEEGISSNEIESLEQHKHKEEKPVYTSQEKDESETEHKQEEEAQKPVTLEVLTSTIKSIDKPEETSDITERPLVPITETIITSKPIYGCEEGSSCDLPQTYEGEDNVKTQEEATTLKSIQTEENEIEIDTTLTTEKSYGYPQESNEIFPEYTTARTKPSEILDEKEPVKVEITEEENSEITQTVPDVTENIEKDIVQPEYIQHTGIPGEVEPTTTLPQEKVQESSTEHVSESILPEIDNASTEKVVQTITVEFNEQEENVPTTQDSIESVTSVVETEEKVPILSQSAEDHLTKLHDHEEEHIPEEETAYEETITEENLPEFVTEITKKKTEETATETEEDKITQKHESETSITTEAYKEASEEVTVGKETIKINHEKATELPNESITETLEITEESKSSEKEHETIRPFTESSEIPTEVPEITAILGTEHKLSEHIPETENTGTENEPETGTESEIQIASDDLDNEDEDHEDHILTEPEEISGHEKETPLYQTEQPADAQPDEQQILPKEQHKEEQPITTKSETPEEIEAITEIIPSKAPEIPESQIKEQLEEQVQTEVDNEDEQKPTEITADSTTSEPKVNEPQIPNETITEQEHEKETPTVSVNELIPEEQPESVITTRKPEEFQIPTDTKAESQENIAITSITPEIPDSTEKIAYSEEISGSSSEAPENQPKIPEDIVEVEKEEEFASEAPEITSATLESSSEKPEFPSESSKTPEFPLEASETPELPSESSETSETPESIVKTSENSEEQIPEEITGVSVTASEVPTESAKLPYDVVSAETTEVPSETLENETTEIPIQTLEETSKPNSLIEEPKPSTLDQEVLIETSEVPVKFPESSTDASESPLETPKSPTEVSKSPTETSEASTETFKTPAEIPEILTETSESPVEIPESSYEISKSPVEIPESSSEVPESPIQISDSSSEVPESPIQISESSSLIPESSSEFPAEILESSPETPESSDKIPESPVEVTESTINFSEFPTEIPEHPLKTPELIEIPDGTSESSAITLQPPTELPDFPVETSEPPAEIPEHPLKTTEPLEIHEETSESSFITSEPSVELSESPTETEEHPLKSQEPTVETTDSPIESPKLPVEEPEIPIETSESALEATEGTPEEPLKSTNESFEEPIGTTEETPETLTEISKVPTQTSEILTETSQLPIEIPEAPIEAESPTEIPELSIEASKSPIEKTEKLPESQENIYTEIPEMSEKEHDMEVATEVIKETEKFPESQENIFTEIPEISEKEHDMEVATEVIEEIGTIQPERIPEQEEMEIITDIPQPTSKPIESFDHVTEGEPKIPIKSDEVERDEIPVVIPEIHVCPPGATCEEPSIYKPSEESKEPCLDVHGCKELHEKTEVPFVSSEIDSVSKPNECEGNINCEIPIKEEITTSQACLEGQDCKEQPPQTEIPSISSEQEYEKEPQFCPEGDNCKEGSLVEAHPQEIETKHEKQPQIAGEIPSHSEIEIPQIIEDHTIKQIHAENEIEQSSVTTIQIESQTLKSISEEPTQPEEPAQTEHVEINVTPEITTIKSIESNKIEESTFEPIENEPQKAPEDNQLPIEEEEDSIVNIASTISSIKEEESTSPQELEEKLIESVTVPQQPEEGNKEQPIEENHEQNEITPVETTSIKQDNIYLEEVSTELPKEHASTERIEGEKIDEFIVTEPQQSTEEEISTERIEEEKTNELNITQFHEIPTEEEVSTEKVEQEKAEIPIQTELPKVSVDISQPELIEKVEDHISPTESNEIVPQTVKSVLEVESESATQKFEDVDIQPTSSTAIFQEQPVSEEATPIGDISKENDKPACKEEECQVSHTIPVESEKDKEQIPISQDEELLNEVSPDALEQNLIPGEGSCLVDGQTYENNSSVPPINRCQISCKCVSSILQCETVSCSPAPSNLENCMPIYHSPDSCCPTYSCTMPGISTIESDSHQMEITTKTVSSEPVTESKLNRETTQSYEGVSNTDESTLKQTESPHDEKPEHTPIPEQPQYSIIEEKPLHTPIGEEPQHTSIEEEPLHTPIEEEEEDTPGEENLTSNEKDHEGGSVDQYEVTTESKLQNKENTPTTSPNIIEETTKALEQHTTEKEEEISQATIKTGEDEQPQSYSSEISEKGQEKDIEEDTNKVTETSEHLITTTEAINTDSTKSSTKKESNEELESVTLGAEDVIHEKLSEKEVTEQDLIVTTEAEVITEKPELIDGKQKQESIGEEAFDEHVVEAESSGLTTELPKQEISHTVTEELSAEEQTEKSEIPLTLDTSLTTEKVILEEEKPEQVPISDEKISEEQTEESVVPSELDAGIEKTSFSTEKVILEEQKPEQIPINEEKISEEQTEESVVPTELDTGIENTSFSTEKVILEEQKPEHVPISDEKISEEQTEESVVSSELDAGIENTSFSTEKVILEEQKPEHVPINEEKISEEQTEESVVPTELDTGIENTLFTTEKVVLEEQKPEHVPINEEKISEEQTEESVVPTELDTGIENISFSTEKVILEEQKPEHVPISEEKISEEQTEESVVPSELDTGIENTSFSTEKVLLEEQKPEHVPINEGKISEEQTEESVVPSELDTGIENTLFTTEKVVLEEQKPEHVPINEEKISEEQTEESVVPSELDTSIENTSFTTEKVLLEEQKPEHVPIGEEKNSEEQTEESVVSSELDTGIENTSFSTEKVILEEQKPEHVPISEEKISEEQTEESVVPSELDTGIEDISLTTEENILEEQKPVHPTITEEKISSDIEKINKPIEKIEGEIQESISKSTEIPEISETESQTLKTIVTEKTELDKESEIQKAVPAISENESTTSYVIATESTKSESEQEENVISEIQPTHTEIPETATIHENVKETEASTAETEKQPHNTLESENEDSVPKVENQKPEEEYEQISTEKDLVEPETQTVKTLLDENITEQEIVHVDEEVKDDITSAAHITESSIISEPEESKPPEIPIIESDTTNKSTSEETMTQITEVSQEEKEKTEESLQTEKPIKEPVQTEEESIQTEQPMEAIQPEKTIHTLPTFEQPSKDTVPTETPIESVETSTEEHVQPQKPMEEPVQTEEPLKEVEVTKSTPENILEMSSEKIEVTTATVEKVTKTPESISSSETSPEVEGPAAEAVTQFILKPELYTSPPHPEKATYKPIIPGQLHTSAPVVPGDLEPLLTTLAPHYHITSTTHAPNYEVTPPTKLPEHVPEPAPEVEYPHPTEEDYDDEETGAFGPGTCRYGGKVYVSAQQIPRDDPCDFCFCFRSDIICLQQSCPPPIPRCHEEPIRGFCCPRYECPVNMATSVNITTTTTTTTTTLPPHFLTHAYRGKATRNGCLIQGQAYKVGEVIRSTSGPCLHCVCGGDGQMQCDPKVCSPEPMLRQMIEATVSSRR